MNQNHESITLLEERATPEVVDSLYRYGLLRQQGRENGLALLNPHENWGYWVSNILLIMGWIFILSSIMYFYAFNWHKMSSYYKFSSIQVMILVCLAGAWAYSIDNLKGKLFLTGGCILIGVFLAIFGQIYQTGANSYELFVAWLLLITPFVIIGQFAPLWAIWLILLNIAIILYWNQALSMSSNQHIYIFSALLLINGVALILREYFYQRHIEYLQGRWHRILLCLMLLLLSFFPISLFILEKEFDNSPLFITSLFGYFIQMGLLYFYRHPFRDRWILALTMLSLNLIICEIAYRILEEFVNNRTLILFFMTLIVLTVFSTSTYLVRRQGVLS
ncbi:MAG: DUF2157 domain-containing protein [Candidatus Berkiella sp.]